MSRKSWAYQIVREMSLSKSRSLNANNS
ncbi:hypothetical protein XACJM35_3390001 [Xanthomonas citri pv. citri]|nr:hypothetical protein XACJM35_3390001 [Xanthomonas citri pv. citri]